MGNKKFSRRSFFKPFSEEISESITVAPPKDTDPLFEKYSRKSLGPRHYSTENITHRVGGDDTSGSTLRGNITTGLAPYTGTWSEWEVLHLLRRTNFGWKKSFVDALLPLGASSAVDRILQIDTTSPAPPVNWYQNFFPDENGIPYGGDWTNDFFAVSTTNSQTINSYRIQSLRRWSYGLVLNGDVSIREKMTWFWYHFIPVDFEDVRNGTGSNGARILYRYMKRLRDSATGNFKTLIRAISTEPAMMYYLNNQVNSATAPDENFARELMELFTLGKGPDSQYTEADVVAAAKVLTGWRVQGMNTATVVTNFVPGSHNTTNKQFSSFFNNRVINNQPGAAGANELDALIDMIFSKETVLAKYICRRLYRYFVYYDIDANVEANVIAPLAQTFVSSSWNILPVLKQLFNSEHFFDAANRGVYIKSPFDLVAGTLNTFNVNTVGNSIDNQYRIWSYFNDTIGLGMEQQMGTVENVSGWNAYYQVPAYHQYWINANTIQKRFDFLQKLFNGYTQNGTAIKINVILFAQLFGAATAADPDLLVAACTKYLLPVDLSPEKKDSIKTLSLLGGQTQNYYWTNAWNDYLADPNSTAKKGIVETRLKTLLSELCQSAEFQLM